MNIVEPAIPSDIQVPPGFRMAGVHCGIKSDASKPDLTLVVSDRPAAAAGVYTQNLVCAAPVVLDRSRTPSDNIRAVVVNSGNANACTGTRGADDALRMCQQVASACGIAGEQVLVMSTGIIGEFLPMQKIDEGIRAAAEALGSDTDALSAAARGIMTTDTVPKVFGKTVRLGRNDYTITGFAKGAAMIGPNMATMLGLVLTDAPLTPAIAQQMLTEIVDDTFNCIHVDGHTSTNDTVLLLAGGDPKSTPLDDVAYLAFHGALRIVCTQLARSIPADGEGASHLITINVRGCHDVEAARTIAKTIANSPLVKTAVTGADPNWGRIVSAAGYAGVPFDPSVVELRVNDYLLYRDARPVDFSAADVSQSIRGQREVTIEFTVNAGDCESTVWTTDLTADYVRLNAEYHT
ncbi:MAG: bifunctional glutamate N-acetyltransferase/amino-acid acetyltransferase ArgJ [Verrucomicrobia bacterium]|nr:bifunctional glutamate N-acetyltransferase/amino-acid acetyltransferase ArgJ [Verrucomicrobiota bacterium]